VVEMVGEKRDMNWQTSTGVDIKQSEARN